MDIYQSIKQLYKKAYKYKSSSKFQERFILLLILIFGTSIIFLLSLNLRIFVILLILIFIHLYLMNKRKKLKKDTFKTIHIISDTIFYCLYIPFKLLLPAAFIIIGIFMTSLLAGILPSLLITYINKYLDLGLNNATILFFAVTLFSMISVYVSPHIFKVIHNHTKYSHKDSLKNCIIELLDFIFHKNNLNYIILLTYLVFLFYTSFYSLQNHEPFFGKEIDLAISKALLIYLAFTNLVKKTQKADFSTHKIYTFFKDIIFVRLLTKKHKKSQTI